MNETSTIEQATTADLDLLFALTCACVARMREQGIDQWDEEYPTKAGIAHDIAAGTLWILREGGVAAGCLTLDERQDPMWSQLDWHHSGGTIAAIHRVMVSPEHQGRGLAKRLMIFAESQAASQGHAVVRLDAFTLNPASLALYERLGYTRAGTAMMRKGAFIGFEKQLAGRGTT